MRRIDRHGLPAKVLENPLDDGHVSDSETDLDWLQLNATFGLSMVDALNANSGWRYATNAEVEDLFSKAFDGYYTTNALLYSSTAEGAYADQIEDVLAFADLFGAINDRSLGWYADEDGIIRLLGGFKISDSLYTVYGPEFISSYSNTETSSVVGTYLVRSSIVPIQATVWLFGSALAGLGWMRRQQRPPFAT